MTIVKVYKIAYIMGIVNPIECYINIESVNDLTEDYIIKEIEKKNPKQKGQIMAILSTFLIEEKVIGNVTEEIQKEETKNIPVFNW